jgi:peptidoglycan hydrolase-like protein with peptidoglycan-binding domain
MRSTFCVVAFIIAGLTAFVANAQNSASAPDVGPSFNCTDHVSPLAQLICKDTGLKLQQLQLMQTRQALSQQLGDAGSKWLNEDNDRFYSGILQKCQVPREGDAPQLTDTMTSCLTTEYQLQRSAWMAWLGPAGLAEASRPIHENIALQKALQTLGFLSTNTRDKPGFYGHETRLSIANWQQAEGLPVNGLLDAPAAIILTREADEVGRFGPSFNCANTSDTFRQLICKNPLLSLFQNRYVQVQEAFVQQLGDAGAKLARTAVDGFYADIKSDCQVDPNFDSSDSSTIPDAQLLCLIKDFKAERAAWMFKLGPAATEEAARSIEESAGFQKALQTRGLLDSRAKIDGIYGPDTRAAIVRLQLAQHLPLTGLLDNATAATLLHPSEAANARKVIDCFKSGSDTIFAMYSCSGVWVTPRILTLCFLGVDGDCPVIPDELGAREVVSAAVGPDKLNEKLSIDLANVLGFPNQTIIDQCNNSPGDRVQCAAQRMTQPAILPLVSCALAPSEKEKAVCLSRGAPNEVASVVECVTNQGVSSAALQQCAKMQPWDKVQAVNSCIGLATSSSARADCLMSELDPAQRSMGKCLADAAEHSTPALSCFSKLDPQAGSRMDEFACALQAGTDQNGLLGCFSQSSKGDAAELAACAVGDQAKMTSCIIGIRPEYKTVAQVVACAQGGRDAGSLVANCSDFLIKDEKTRAVLGCAAEAGSSSEKLAGCAASTVFPPEIARYASCAATSQGPTSFALCAAGPVMNEEWRIAAECAVQTGGNPVGFAGCTAGRLTLKELTQCFSGGSCFGKNNTIVKFYTNEFNDLLHGPGANNDIVVAWNKLKQDLSGGPNSVINNPDQLLGGNNSLFHSPGQILGGANSVANQILSKPLGGDRSAVNQFLQYPLGGNCSVVRNPFGHGC